MPSRPEYPAFSRLLIAALTRADRTQTWLGERLGITQQHASDIANGKHRPPRDKIEAMAELLGLENADRQAFLNEAYLTHVPDFIRARIQRIEDQLDARVRESDAAMAELGALSAEVSRLQRAAADLSALRAAVEGLAQRHPDLGPELRALLAAPPLGERATEDRR